MAAKEISRTDRDLGRIFYRRDAFILNPFQPQSYPGIGVFGGGGCRPGMHNHPLCHHKALIDEFLYDARLHNVAEAGDHEQTFVWDCKAAVMVEHFRMDACRQVGKDKLEAPFNRVRRSAKKMQPVFHAVESRILH